MRSSVLTPAALAPAHGRTILNSLLVVGLVPGVVMAQTAPAPQAEAVVISGSLIERTLRDAPYAISVIDQQDIRAAGAMINASEALQRLPGLVANNRSNFAQDLQISSRGFGARSGFGVRGLRIVADGLPATGPDGQGQVSQFDLASAQRIEVLRGPFSALYGNSSGGVISIVSAPITANSFRFESDAGSFGLRQNRIGAQAKGAGGGASQRYRFAGRARWIPPAKRCRQATGQCPLGLAWLERRCHAAGGLPQPAGR
jgi:iron complex outermembrane receptor protein